MLGYVITTAVRSAVRSAQACIGAGDREDIFLAGQEVASSDPDSRWVRTVNRVATASCAIATTVTAHPFNRSISAHLRIRDSFSSMVSHRKCAPPSESL